MSKRLIPHKERQYKYEARLDKIGRFFSQAAFGLTGLQIGNKVGEYIGNDLIHLLFIVMFGLLGIRLAKKILLNTSPIKK